jgi:hypothetical protein
MDRISDSGSEDLGSSPDGITISPVIEMITGFFIQFLTQSSSRSDKLQNPKRVFNSLLRHLFNEPFLNIIHTKIYGFFATVQGGASQIFRWILTLNTLL